MGWNDTDERRPYRRDDLVSREAPVAEVAAVVDEGLAELMDVRGGRERRDPEAFGGAHQSGWKWR